jgi:hypothetical protein
MTPSRIEPATFRFLAQYLNHCATVVPCVIRVIKSKCYDELCIKHAREQGTCPQWQVTVRRRTSISKLILQWILYKLRGMDWIDLVHGWNNSLSS